MTDYHTRPCSNPPGWTSVSYMHGEEVRDTHHWPQATSAELHARLLNEGVSPQKAVRRTMREAD